MRIEALELHNYGSFHGSHVFPLANRGLTMVLGKNEDEPRMNSNGAGKSSLFDCLDWTLFGVIPKGDHVDSVINDEESEARGVARLFDEERGLPLVVQRTKKRNKGGTLEYWLGDQHVQAQDTKETQRLLELELGLDRDVFHSAVLFGQNDIKHFADATGGERMDMLTKILPELNEIDGWLEKAKAVAKDIDDQRQRAEMEASSLQGQQQSLEQTYSSNDVQIQRWEADKAQRLQQIQVDIDAALARYNAVKSELVDDTQAKGELAALEAQMAQRQADQDRQRQDIDIRLRQALEQGTKARSTLDLCKSAVSRLQGEVAALQSKVGVCPECGQPVTQEHMAGRIAEKQNELVARQTEVSQLEANVTSLRACYVEVDAERKRFEESVRADNQQFGEVVIQARQRVAYMDQRRGEAAQLEARWRGEQQRLQQAQEATNPFVGEQWKLHDRLQGLSQGAHHQRQLAAKHADDLRYFDFWVEALGSKGLKNYILDGRLQEMTDAANQWVKLLTGGTIWIRFETQKMGRSTKKLTNDLNVRVFRYNPNGSITERNYRSWSGGEKKRVSWAIDFGLSRLVAARARKRYDLLVLDELFSYVDAAGGEAVVEMLSHLRQEKNSIFVIEHDADFQAHFENHVWVRLKSRRSVILERESDDERAQGFQGDGQAGEQAVEKKKPPRKKKRGGVRVDPDVRKKRPPRNRA